MAYFQSQIGMNNSKYQFWRKINYLQPLVSILYLNMLRVLKLNFKTSGRTTKFSHGNTCIYKMNIKFIDKGIRNLTVFSRNSTNHVIFTEHEFLTNLLVCEFREISCRRNKIGYIMSSSASQNWFSKFKYTKLIHTCSILI